MKIWNPNYPTFLGVVACAGVLSCSARAADEALIELIPETALLVVHAADAAKLPESLKTSPLGKMWADGKFQKFIAPSKTAMEENPAVVAGMKAMKEAMSTFEGEAVAALVRLPVDYLMEAMDGDGGDAKAMADAMEKDLRMVVMGKVPVDGKGFEETWTGLVEKAMEETKSEGDAYEMVKETVDGQEIHVARETPAKVDKSYDVIAFAKVGDVGIIGSPRAAVDETLAALKKGLAGGKLTEGAFGRFHQRNPDNDVHFHVNLAPLVDAGKKALLKLEAAGALGDQMAGMGVTIESIWKALGLADLQSLDLGLSLEKDSTVLDTGLLYAKRSGLMQLLAYTNGAPPKTDFIPQDVGSASVSLFSLKDAYVALMGMLEAALPQMMPMVKAQLAGAEGQLGVSIEKDLLGNLKPVILSLQSMGQSDDKQLQDEMIVMLGLENEQGFEVAFDKVLAFVSGMTGFAFEPSEFLGHKLKSFEAPAMGPGANPTKISYLFTKGYFVLSIGKGELLRKVLSNIERPGKSLWDSAHVKAAMGQLKDGYCEFQYMDAGQLVFSLIEMGAELPDAEELPFDWDQKLSQKEWQALLGFMVGAGYLEKDGIYGKSILLPNE